MELLREHLDEWLEMPSGEQRKAPMAQWLVTDLRELFWNLGPFFSVLLPAGEIFEKLWPSWAKIFELRFLRGSESGQESRAPLVLHKDLQR